MIHRFLSTAFRNYFTVGGVVPSSKYTSQKVVSKLPKNCKHIVEYGGGTGAITLELLKRLPEDGKLFVVELQEEFVRALREVKDPRLTVIHGDVEVYSTKLRQFFPDGPEAVVSGIPFLFFNEASRKNIIENTKKEIAPNGRFIIYQHSLQLLSYLKSIFTVVKLDIEIRNFPPYFVMTSFK